MISALPVDKLPDIGRIDHSLAYKVLPINGLVEVYDLDFAGYCCLQSLAIVDMIESGSARQRGKGSHSKQYVFVFKATAEKIASVCVDYANSESARHADCVRRLKKGVRSTRAREG
jgi:hypothetical protein